MGRRRVRPRLNLVPFQLGDSQKTFPVDLPQFSSAADTDSFYVYCEYARVILHVGDGETPVQTTQ